MDITRLPADWPFRDRIRRIALPGVDWAVAEVGAEAGEGPDLLLLHGAGGAMHSFRALAPALPGYRLLIPDLPGQGCSRTRAPGRFGLDAMAEDLCRLATQQGWRPQAVIGHSAGGAVALRLSELMPLKAVIGLNAALGTFEGAAGVFFPILAKMLAALPFVPDVVARLWGNPAKVNQLLDSTGSRIDAAGRAQYLTLVRDRDHVAGTLGMMADWRLEGLLSRLPQITTPTLLLTGSKDHAVPPRVSQAAAARMPAARWQDLPGLGHLMQEEDATATAAAILPFLSSRLAAA